MKTIRTTSRRKFLKTTAAFGIAALAAPAIISRGALASSGEVNFMGWAGYPELAKTVFPAFEKSTGIKVNFNEQPDQDSMFAQGKLSLQTGAVDVVEPTLDRAAGWYSNGLIQGWNTNDLAMDNYVTGLADGAAGDLAVVDGKRLIVPSVWGTEAIVYSKTEAPTTYGQCSLGDLWADKYAGKVCVRAPFRPRGDGPLPRFRGQASEALARQLQERSGYAAALGHRAGRGDQAQGQCRAVLERRERRPGGLSDQRRRDRA